MNAKRFRFVSPGDVTVGVVRGVGAGSVSTLKQMLVLQKTAQAGGRLTVYEPKPGHVSVYCDYQDGQNTGHAESVDLTRADLTILDLNPNLNEPVFRING